MAGIAQFVLILAAIVAAASLFAVLFAISWAIGAIYLWTQGKKVDK